MWSCIDFVFSFSLSVCFHSHSVAAPVLSPSSSSPCPTCLRTAVMKSWRKRKRRIFQGFSLGPGISAKVCCMLQRAAWPLTTARCAQCWHCKGKKRDSPNSGVETWWLMSSGWQKQHFSRFSLLSAQIVSIAQEFFRPIQLTAEMWARRPLNFHTGRVCWITVVLEDWFSGIQIMLADCLTELMRARCLLWSVVSP